MNIFIRFFKFIINKFFKARQSLLSAPEASRPVNITQMLSQPRSILIIPYNRMGTVLLASHVFKSVRQKYSDATIAVAVHESWGVLVRKDTYVDEVITYTDEIADPHSKEFQLFSKELSNYKFDITLYLSCQYDEKMAYFSRLTDSPLRISYNFSEENDFFNVMIQPSPDSIYQVDQYFSMLRTIGIDCTNRDYTLTLNNKTREKAQLRYLPSISKKDLSKLVGFDLTKEIEGESISKESAETIISTLITKFNATVAILYDPEKTELATAFKDLFGKGVVLVPIHPISMLAGLTTFCRFVITHNTDLFQLVVALKVPTIAILTQSEMKQWSPGESETLMHLECSSEHWPTAEQIVESVKTFVSNQKDE